MSNEDEKDEDRRMSDYSTMPTRAANQPHAHFGLGISCLFVCLFTSNALLPLAMTWDMRVPVPSLGC